MKIKSAVFDVSSPDLKSCPRWALPEFAFIGRSNVGKSSLINLLAERRDLARVSDLPGKTRLINFFLVNGAWSLVDLPGYGFARVGTKQQRAFSQAVGDYLGQRRNLFHVFVLIDSRLPPQAIDLEFIGWLRTCPAKFSLIFTKLDKQSTTVGQANIELFRQALSEQSIEPPEIFASSSKTKAGRTEILDFIQRTLAQNNRA